MKRVLSEEEAAEYADLAVSHERLTTARNIVRARMEKLAPTTPQEDYRIALRPNYDHEDPFSPNTDCDDIVVRGVPMFRAEQMDVNQWWVACYLNDDYSDRICWWVTAKARPVRLEWRTTELPSDNSIVYEHEIRAGSDG